MSDSASDSWVRTASATARSTVIMVPGTGSATASPANRAPRESASRRPGPSTIGVSASASAMPRSSWEVITPELPRAPVSAPRASTPRAVPASARSLAGARSNASSAARMVCTRFDPVSLSATG